MLNEQLSVKVNDEELTNFTRKCEAELGKPYTHFLREIIKAYNEDRLRIIPTEDQKRGVLYEH